MAAEEVGASNYSLFKPANNNANQRDDHANHFHVDNRNPLLSSITLFNQVSRIDLRQWLTLRYQNNTHGADSYAINKVNGIALTSAQISTLQTNGHLSLNDGLGDIYINSYNDFTQHGIFFFVPGAGNRNVSFEFAVTDNDPNYLQKDTTSGPKNLTFQTSVNFVSVKSAAQSVFTLNGTVGENCTNNAMDVLMVKARLNELGFTADDGTPLVVNGLMTGADKDRLIQALLRFQRVYYTKGTPDGKLQAKDNSIVNSSGYKWLQAQNPFVWKQIALATSSNTQRIFIDWLRRYFVVASFGRLILPLLARLRFKTEYLEEPVSIRENVFTGQGIPPGSHCA